MHRLKFIAFLCVVLVFPIRGVAADTINYMVPGIVPSIKQPNSMACWATVATIMYSWKNKKSVEIRDVLKVSGKKYEDIFSNNSGLSAADKAAFLKSLDLKAEAPQNFTIAGWEKLLRQVGPIWVTTDEAPVGRFAIHARVLTGIKGDGTATGTVFYVVDPATGISGAETVAAFISKFEQVARDDLGVGAELRPQVVHY